MLSHRTRQAKLQTLQQSRDHLIPRNYIQYITSITTVKCHEPDILTYKCIAKIYHIFWICNLLIRMYLFEPILAVVNKRYVITCGCSIRFDGASIPPLNTFYNLPICFTGIFPWKGCVLGSIAIIIPIFKRHRNLITTVPTYLGS